MTDVFESVEIKVNSVFMVSFNLFIEAQYTLWNKHLLIVIIHVICNCCYKQQQN